MDVLFIFSFFYNGISHLYKCVYIMCYTHSIHIFFVSFSLVVFFFQPSRSNKQMTREKQRDIKKNIRTNISWNQTKKFFSNDMHWVLVNMQWQHEWCTLIEYNVFQLNVMDCLYCYWFNFVEKDRIFCSFFFLHSHLGDDTFR